MAERFDLEKSAKEIDRLRAEAEQISFNARALGTKLHDDALAAQEKSVRENAQALGLSSRETQKRVNNVRKRFKFK